MGEIQQVDSCCHLAWLVILFLSCSYLHCTVGGGGGG